jgi:hypothetical protein
MAMMTDHWQVIEDELQRSRDALAFACLSHNFTPPAIKVRCDKMDAALAFVREQRQLAAHPDAGEWIKVEGDIEGDDTLYVQNGQLYAVTEYGEINIEFPAGYAVCRKQEGDTDQ